jgi:hypothetical protein
MKKFSAIAVSIIALVCFVGVLNAAAAPYLPVQGGTGTGVAPTSGQLLIGNGAGSYTVASLGSGGTVSLSIGSGTITITGTGTTTTIQSVLNALSAQGLATYNSSTGVFTVSSSTLNLGTASTRPSTDFLSSSTLYVSSFNTRTGAVTLSSGDVTTALGFTPLSKAVTSINGASSTNQTIVGGTGESVGTIAGATNSTTTVTNTGVTTFTGAGCVTSANSTGSVALAVSCISGNQNILFTIAGDATGTSSGTTAITDTVTVIGLNGKALPANTTGTLQYSAGAWSINLASNALGIYNSNGVLSSYVGSSCGGGQYVTGFSATGTVACATPPASATYTVTGGTGISTSVATSGGNTTTTVTNTGVTSFAGSGCATAANSTGTVTLSVTCISANQTITFTIIGDATGTATGATAITDSITVTGLNGKALPANTTGTLEYVGGAWAINLATSSLGIYDANGNLSSYLGSSCSGSQYVTGFSANGTVSCGTPTGSNTNTIVGSGTVTTTVASAGGNTTTTVTLANSGVAAGAYTCVSETVASSGLVTVASSGTCGTSNVSTSTSNTWGGTQSFGTTTVQSLNNIQFVPAVLSASGCDTSSTPTTFQDCVHGIYASMAPLGGGTIWVTNDVTSTWTSLLSFNINGDQVSLNCAANIILQYTGTSTPAGDTWLPSGGNYALNFDFGNPIGHAQTSDDGGCDLRGNSSLIAANQTNNATSTGVYLGGTYSFTGVGSATTSNAGAVGVNLDYNVNGFGRNVAYGANAYVDEFLGTSSGGNCNAMVGCLLYFSVANNSGERWVMQGGSYTDPGNNTTSNAIYLTNAGTASLFFNYNSADNAQLVCGSSDGQCDVSQNHLENAGCSYPTYNMIYNPSSDESTSINASFEEIANDCTGATSTVTVIKHGGQLTAIGDHIDNYGGGTITNFSDHSNDNGLESELICQLQVSQGTLTNIVAGNGNITYSLATGNGCVTDNGNSYPIEIFPNASNVNDINSGNNTVGTFDNTGDWTFGIAGTGGTVGVNEQYYSVFASSTANASNTTINWNNSNVQELKLTTSTTISFTNRQAGARYILTLLQDSTGSRTVTWPSYIQWASGTAPTLTTTVNKMDIITFVCAAVSSTNCYAGSNLNYSP